MLDAGVVQISVLAVTGNVNLEFSALPCYQIFPEKADILIKNVNDILKR